jgi:serine/threonine protein kinase/WD40 repeat protein
MDPSTDLLQRLLQRPEQEWEQALAETCAAHPEHATDVQRKFQSLRESGLVASGPALAATSRLGEFSLGRLLGQGGMGVVYEARQERLDRTVALKVVRADLLYFPGARERFRREIEAVARLSHPGIVTVLTVGDDQELPFIAMELLRGASLEDVVRELAGHDPSQLTGADLAAIVARHANVPTATVAAPLFQGTWIDTCLAIGKQIADALEHAHARGVLHRDVKPSNVIVTSEGRVVLLDFGLAALGGVDRLTRAGSEVGSIPYMAPEQVRGEAGDARSDVYSLGVTLRELLALRHPFLAASREVTRQRILAGESLRLSELNAAVPWELRTVCAAATDVDPARRYGSAALLAQDLVNARAHRPILARPSGSVRRLWRWSQRRPALATALGLGLLTAIGTPTAIALGIRSQRDRARAAEIEEQHRTYEANVAAANAALQGSDAREARRRLDACPPALRGFEWHHLALALDGSLLTLRGHGAAVTSVAVTPDAALLASGAEDGEVCLWDLSRGEIVQRFAHHRARVDQLVFAPDSATLLVADVMQHASAIDVALRSVRGQWRPGHRNESIRLGADGSCALVDLGGWRFQRLHAATLAVERELALEQIGPAPSSCLATDGKHLFTVGYAMRARNDLICFDLTSGRRVYCAPMPREASVRTIALSAGGERVAVSDKEGRITVHTAADGALEQVLADRPGAAGGLAEKGAQLAFDRRGALLAAAGADGGLRVFDVASGVLLSAQAGHDGPANAVALDAGVLAATGGEDHFVRLWSPFGGRETQVMRGHSGAVRGLAIVPAADGPDPTTAHGELLVSVSEDSTLRLWDTATGMPCGHVGGHSHHANTLAVTAAGTRAFSTFHDSVVTTAIPSLEQQSAWRCGGNWIFSLELGPDGRTLLAATATGEVLLLDPQERRVVRSLRGHDGPALACAFASGGAIAYSGGQDGRLLRWDLTAGADTPQVVRAGGLPIKAIALAGDGRTLFLLQGSLSWQARSLDDGAVLAIAADGAVLWERRCSSQPRSLVLLPDGTRLATGHDDGTVTVWDAARGVPLLVRRLAPAPIRALACHPSGRRLYAGAADDDRSCYALWMDREIEPRRARELAFATAAMHRHTTMWAGLGTSEDRLALIRAEPDLELRTLLETCERYSPPISWRQLALSLDLCVTPGLPREHYAQALRAAESVRSPVNILATRVLATRVAFLANVRLGEPERALACVEGIGATGEWRDLEPELCAGRALALAQLGRREAATIEAERLRQLAAMEAASAETISLWREVEAALR